MLITSPTRTEAFAPRLFAARSAPRLTRYCVAMPDSVSPRVTMCSAGTCLPVFAANHVPVGGVYVK